MILYCVTTKSLCNVESHEIFSIESAMTQKYPLISFDFLLARFRRSKIMNSIVIVYRPL